MVFAIKQAMQ